MGIQMRRIEFHVTHEVFGRGRVLASKHSNYEEALEAFNQVASGHNKDLRKIEIMEHDYYMNIDEKGDEE
jgi:hypothetical protein